MQRLLNGLSYLLGCAFILILIHYLLEYRASYIREVDNQAYYQMAKSLAQFRLPVWQDDYFYFAGHPYVGVGENQVAVKYTLGWPLLLAMGYLVAGVEGAFWINTIMAVIVAVVFFLLVRTLFGAVAAACCSVIFLISPHLFPYLVVQLTHVVDIAFILMSLYFSLLWVRGGGWVTAMLAGLSLGFMPLVRSVDVLLYPALALAAYAYRRSEVKMRAEVKPLRHIRVLLISMGIPLFLMMIYNQLVFGAFWRTGYYFTEEQHLGFEWERLSKRLSLLYENRHFYFNDIAWIAVILGWVYGLIRYPLMAISFILWVAPIFFLYTVYYFVSSYAPTYMRFYLGLLPACVMCVGFFFIDLKRHWTLLIVAMGLCGYWCHHSLKDPDTLRRLNNIVNNKYVRAGMHEMREHLKENTVIYTFHSQVYYANAFPGVEAYDMNRWSLRARMKLLKNIEGRVEGHGVWGDKHRSAKVRKAYQELGDAGLKKEFLKLVNRQLDDGKRILFMRAGRPMTWCKQQRGFEIRQIAGGNNHRKAVFELTRS